MAANHRVQRPPVPRGKVPRRRVPRRVHAPVRQSGRSTSLPDPRPLPGFADRRSSRLRRHRATPSRRGRSLRAWRRSRRRPRFRCCRTVRVGRCPRHRNTVLWRAAARSGTHPASSPTSWRRRSSGTCRRQIHRILHRACPVAGSRSRKAAAASRIPRRGPSRDRCHRQPPGRAGKNRSTRRARQPPAAAALPAWPRATRRRHRARPNR